MKLGHVRVRGGGLTVHAWASEQGLAAVRVGEVPDAATETGLFPVEGVEVVPPEGSLDSLARAVAAYLRGNPLSWDGALDQRGLTPFQRDVLDAVREVPFGEICTYGSVARALGRPQAVRAVGSALHRNPFPLVVPCHRVVREGGTLGGYSCGVEMKRRLLALEAGQRSLFSREDDA